MIDTSIFKYLRACYRENYGRDSLLNIFHRSVENRIFFEGNEEVLSGAMESAPLDIDPSLGLREKVQSYRKEKDLIYGSLLLIGRSDDSDAPFLCTPLIMFPAELDRHRYTEFVSVDWDSLRINTSALEHLPLGDKTDVLMDAITPALRTKPLSSAAIGAVINAFETHLGKECGDLLVDWPKLKSERDVRKIMRRLQHLKTGQFRIVPASFVALVKKSHRLRGVLNELEELASLDQAGFSQGIHALFGEGQLEDTERIKPKSAPAVLSNAQERVLDSAANNPLTLVIGPPGSGKTFTISAVATEHISRGQRVLIVSKMDHAVDVIAAKTGELSELKQCLVRGGSRNYLKNLKLQLKNLFSYTPPMDFQKLNEIRLAERNLKKVERYIRGQEKNIIKVSEREKQWGEALARDQTVWVNKIIASVNRFQAKMKLPLWEYFNHLSEAMKNRIETERDIVRLSYHHQLDRSLRFSRRQLRNLEKAIKARTGSRQDRIFSETDFAEILKPFPIWLVNLGDINKVLPHHADLFDLVIIDEATQCDIASCMPAIQRARRVLVTGDPHQLSHISFLSRKRQQELAEESELSVEWRESLDFRGSNILDLVNDRIEDQSQVIFLDEHFRSEPGIIAFSNQRFYQDGLRIMTRKPGVKRAPLKLVQGGGVRSAAGINEEEAARVIGSVLERMKDSFDSYPSIGILSPFRAQVDHLVELVSSQIPYELQERHQLLIGTAHTFQGEERDLMFLSLALDDDYHSASLRFLENPGVFNVSITRARVYQEVHVSFQRNAIPMDSLLGEYLRHIDKFEVEHVRDVGSGPADQFFQEVKEALANYHVEVIPDFEVAGMVMDFVAFRGDRRIAVDLIGYPGDYHDFMPMDRYRIFSRVGLQIFALPYSKWLADKEGAVQAMLDMMHKSGQKPE